MASGPRECAPWLARAKIATVKARLQRRSSSRIIPGSGWYASCIAPTGARPDRRFALVRWGATNHEECHLSLGALALCRIGVAPSNPEVPGRRGSDAGGLGGQADALCWQRGKRYRLAIGSRADGMEPGRRVDARPGPARDCLLQGPWPADAHRVCRGAVACAGVADGPLPAAGLSGCAHRSAGLRGVPAEPVTDPAARRGEGDPQRIADDGEEQEARWDSSRTAAARAGGPPWRTTAIWAAGALRCTRRITYRLTSSPARTITGEKMMISGHRAREMTAWLTGLGASSGQDKAATAQAPICPPG